MSDKTVNTTQTKLSWKTRIRQMGLAAFLFFLIKGLIWLAIFFGMGTWIKDLF